MPDVLKKAKGWGPYVRSMATPALTSGKYPVRLKTAICADICREARNVLVHMDNATLPCSVRDGLALQWKDRLASHLALAAWPGDDAVHTLNLSDALGQVVGQVGSHLTQATEEGKELPCELFYALFTFTNLTNLAFEMEEALTDHSATLDGRIWRQEAHVRRRDLVLNVPRMHS